MLSSKASTVDQDGEGQQILPHQKLARHIFVPRGLERDGAVQVADAATLTSARLAAWSL